MCTTAGRNSAEGGAGQVGHSGGAAKSARGTAEQMFRRQLAHTRKQAEASMRR